MVRKSKTFEKVVLSFVMSFASLLSNEPSTEEVAKPYYAHPGIVAEEKGGVIGSDHLLNLQMPIAIVVDILKPEGASLPFRQEDVEALIHKKFKDKGIASREAGMGLQLPFFDMLIVLYPIDQGVVALCDGRLFESVDPQRVKLENNVYFQAITWEKKTLVVAPKDDFVSLLMKTVGEIVDTFIERYDYFKEIGRKKTF